MMNQLFNMEGSGSPGNVRARSTPMTAVQRDAIRRAFEKLGVAAAREQFGLVQEVTGVRISAVAELLESDAAVLIHGLEARVRNVGNVRTGNSWSDREEDTWIDRL